MNIKDIQEGKVYFFADPDNGISSGNYRVQKINGEVINLVSIDDSASEFQAYAHELSKTMFYFLIAKPVGDAKSKDVVLSVMKSETEDRPVKKHLHGREIGCTMIPKKDYCVLAKYIPNYFQA